EKGMEPYDFELADMLRTVSVVPPDCVRASGHAPRMRVVGAEHISACAHGSCGKAAAGVGRRADGSPIVMSDTERKAPKEESCSVSGRSRRLRSASSPWVHSYP